jgi:DHA2 family multidrug resistance protein-like MFS transporter
MLTPALARRARPGMLVAGGLVVAALGAGLLTMLGSDSGVALPVASWVVMAVGTAPVITLSTDLVVGSAPPERAGTASGLSETSNELGAALGIAILGSIANAVYRSQLSGAVPDGVSSHAASAAKDTLGGATSVAGQLPESVLQAASEAFSDGLRLGALTCAALALGMAVLVWLYLVRGART